MKTTFGKIKSLGPCKDDWVKLMELNPENDMDKEVTILDILNHSGVRFAFKALRTQPYREYCLILADVAESVLHIFEERYPKYKRPRLAIEAVRLWYTGKTTKEDLAKAAFWAGVDGNMIYSRSYAAYGAANAASYSACAHNVYLGADPSQCAYDAAYAASDKFYTSEHVIREAAFTAQWEKNEEILRKYLEV